MDTAMYVSHPGGLLAVLTTGGSSGAARKTQLRSIHVGQTAALSLA